MRVRKPRVRETVKGGVHTLSIKSLDTHTRNTYLQVMCREMCGYFLLGGHASWLATGDVCDAIDFYLFFLSLRVFLLRDIPRPVRSSDFSRFFFCLEEMGKGWRTRWKKSDDSCPIELPRGCWGGKLDPECYTCFKIETRISFSRIIIKEGRGNFQTYLNNK